MAPLRKGLFISNMKTIKKILFLLLLLGTGFCIQQEITIEEAATLLSKDTLSGSIASDKTQQLLNTAKREIQVADRKSVV